MRIAYRDGWTETFLNAVRVELDGGMLARVRRRDLYVPSATIADFWERYSLPDVFIPAWDIAEVYAL
jgi:hypothetical protein